MCLDKAVKIGLLGAVINNGNLGCKALTYSLISCLEKVAEASDRMFQYFIFEDCSDSIQTNMLCEELDLNTEYISSYYEGPAFRLRSMIRHPLTAYHGKRAIRNCDVVIDLTAGDSFTDIYGQARFEQVTSRKEKILKMGIPLILGPQTYGPFQDPQNEKRVKTILEKAACVISRDQISADYIATFSDVPVHVTTDLAFMLPWKQQEKTGGQKKIGVNISSLLVKNKTEDTDTDFVMCTDYDAYITTILESLKNRDWEVHIIPHVDRDGGFQFRKQFPNFIYHDAFFSPIEAKNCIAGMDAFIGARMHATVAAFSTGVATIPTAYSRKFSGLYNNLGYPYVVDLAGMTTEVAVEQTLTYLEKMESLVATGYDSMNAVCIRSEENKKILLNQISQILQKR